MRYAISRVDDIRSCFEMFLTESIKTIVLNMTNLEGRRVYEDNWKEVDQTDVQADGGLFILTVSPDPETNLPPVDVIHFL